MMAVCLSMLSLRVGRVELLASSCANLAFTLLMLSAIEGRESLACSVRLRSRRNVSASSSD
jgi:hypothetical protein